jgi:hypothetical protein
MKTVVVQITNEKAYKLLQDLADLNLIKMHPKESESSVKLSEKYAGKLPSVIADEL